MRLLALASPALLIWLGWAGLTLSGRWGGREAEAATLVALLPLGLVAALLAIRTARGETIMGWRYAGYAIAAIDTAIGIAGAYVGFMLATTPPIG